MDFKPIRGAILCAALACTTSNPAGNRPQTIPRPSLELTLQQLPEEITSQLPNLIQPKDDVDGGNEIEKIYYTITSDGEALKIEYNVVFERETYPARMLSCIKDILHSIEYGRTEDIETIDIRFNGNTLESVGFPRTYSGEQEYGVMAPEHKTATIAAPIKDIYVNTWNHMFSEKDTNEQMEKYPWKPVKKDGELVYRCSNGLEAKLMPGSRETAEKESK